MSNPLTGSARFTYDGQNYLLVINNGVWIEAEDVLGYSILDAVDELRIALETGRNPKLKIMVAILYGGLVQNHPGISENLVVDMMMSGDPEVRDALLKAMQGAQPPSLADDAAEAGNGQHQPERAKPAGTGKRSSKAGAKRDSRR